MDSSPSQIVANYLACWNETDATPRRRLVEQTWAPRARSVDPIADVSGHDAIDAMLAATQAQFPGHRFEAVGTISKHHDVLHWGWRLAGSDGATVVTGFDVAIVTDGRIETLVGFFDQ